MNLTLTDRDGRDLARLELTPTGVHLELLNPGPEPGRVAAALRGLAAILNNSGKPEAANNSDRWLSPKEAAKVFAVTPAWLRAHAGSLASKVGRRTIRYRAKDLARFFERRRDMGR